MGVAWDLGFPLPLPLERGFLGLEGPGMLIGELQGEKEGWGLSIPSHLFNTLPVLKGTFWKSDKGHDVER